MTRRKWMWSVLGLIGSTMLMGGIWWSSLARAAPVVINETAVPPVPTLNSVRVTQGATLSAQYCAQCHGADLEGARDWKRPLADGSLPAPPHDSSGHTWHHSDKTLYDIIARGGQAVYGDAATKSNMPAFNDRLTADELTAILEFFKSRWGKDEREFQWWMSVTRDGTDQP